jgi:NMD protein affecting ribosome stability and mRNA decay
MTQPVHKTCYRCGRSVREFVDSAQALAAEHGVCDDCKRTVEAETAAREWRLAHGNDSARTEGEG